MLTTIITKWGVVEYHNKYKGKKIKTIHNMEIIKQFKDVFLQEISELLPRIDIDFLIELV